MDKLWILKLTSWGLSYISKFETSMPGRGPIIDNHSITGAPYLFCTSALPQGFDLGIKTEIVVKLEREKIMTHILSLEIMFLKFYWYYYIYRKPITHLGRSRIIQDVYIQNVHHHLITHR